MKSHHLTQALLVSAVIAVSRLPARGDAVDYHLERITGLVNQPTYLTQAPGDAANVLFYSTRISTAISGSGANNSMGKIFRLEINGTTSTSTSILTLASRNVTLDNGLQTFAFNPDFFNLTASGYGKVYVASAATGGPSFNRVEEFTVLNANGTYKSETESFATRVTILQYANNAQNNHTVDWVGFDPNATGAARNYLYISTGDGSYGNGYNNGTGTNGRPSQNPSNLMGKILRVDIAGPDAYPDNASKNFAIPVTNPVPLYNAAHPGAPLMGLDNSGSPVEAFGEVIATGVRNGYRMSFDRANSNIYFGDVGEFQHEEVNILTPAMLANGPADYGWPQREGLLGSGVATVTGGNVAGPQTGTNPFTGATTIDPIQTYTHLVGQAAIGGYVYRGPVASLQGKYFYADFVTGKIWQLDFDPSTSPDAFNGHNGTSIGIDPLWNALITDPANPNYISGVGLGAQSGIDHLVSFSEDNAGNLYIIDFGFGTGFEGQYSANVGEIYKVVPGALSVPATAVWYGNLNNNWGASGGGNFKSAESGGSTLTQLPGYTTNIVLVGTGSGATNANPVLNQDVFVNSLTVKAGAPVATINNGSSGTATITILGSEGIVVESGSRGLTIGANVQLGFNQSWANNSTASMLMNGQISGPGGIALTGTLTMGSTGSLNFYGPLTMNANSKLSISANGGTIGKLVTTPTSIIENATSVGGLSVLVTYSSENAVFTGTMRNGPSGTLGFRVNGGGVVSTSATVGSMTFTGSVNVRYGALVLNGTQHAVGGTSTVIIGDATNLPALLVVNGAAVSGTSAAGSAAVQVGAGLSQGALVLNSGSVTSPTELWVSTQDLGAGALVVNGGQLTTGSWLAIARGGGTGLFTVSGGTVTVSNSPISVGSTGAGSATFRAVATFTSGIINANQNVYAGEINSGIITLAGDAQLNITSANGGSGVNNGINGLGIGNSANTRGIFNLNGGTLTTPHIMKRSGQTGNTAFFNFNGGVLRPNGTASLTDFITNLNGAYVYGGGAIIDDTGKTMVIAQPLLAPTGNGIASITLSGGTGYIAPPVISISGGNTNGGTAIAHIDTAGNLTSVTITNPGVNYAAPPTLTIFGGAGEPIDASYTVTLAPNIGGGLTKLGTGTLILTGANTYSGPTNIQSGTLQIGNGTTGTLGAGNVINSASLTFNRSNTLTVSNAITGAGTLTHAGTGTTTLTGIYSASGPMAINAGTLAFGNTSAPRQETGVLVNLKNLSMGASTVLDSANRDLLIGNTTLLNVETKILAGFGALPDGNPSGPTDPIITSSTMVSSGNTFLVPIDADAVLGDGSPGSAIGQLWDNVAITESGSVIVKYTYVGDADLNGKVDYGDYGPILANFGQTTPGLADIQTAWFMGDLDLSGLVDYGDYGPILATFGQGAGNPLGGLEALEYVPEPSSLLIAGTGMLLMFTRQNKRVRRG